MLLVQLRWLAIAGQAAAITLAHVALGIALPLPQMAAALLVFFVNRINQNLRRREITLAKLARQSIEEDHIVRMGLLASGAAHELGTPLATLSVLVNDWERMPGLAQDSELIEDIAQMKTQVQRCKAIVSKILISAGEARGEGTVRTTVSAFLRDATPVETRRSVLIVEDDASFAKTLQRSFERRGYKVFVSHGIDGVRALLPTASPGYCVVDLRLDGESGLECVKALHAHDPATRIVVLTGFASIATAVEAIKLGACHYLAKPSSTDDIEEAFGRSGGDASVTLSERHTSLKNLEWECIHQTLVDTGFNISEAARRLGMHRRTLARKLEKRRVN